MRNVYKILLCKPQGKRPLGGPGIDGRIILFMNYKGKVSGSTDWTKVAA
jgi:hypothetical protein